MPNGGARHRSCIKVPRAFLGLAFESIALGIDLDRGEFIHIEEDCTYVHVFEVRKAVELSSDSKLKGSMFRRTYHESKDA